MGKIWVESQFGESIDNIVIHFPSIHWRFCRKDDFLHNNFRGICYGWSMSDLEVVTSHLSLKQVRLWDHSINIQVHNSFWKGFIVKAATFRVLIKESTHLVFLKVAAKFIKSSFELLIVTFLLVPQVKVRKSFLSRFPLISFSITLESDFFKEGMLNFLESFFSNMILWSLQIPSVDDQLFKILHKMKYTVSRSLGTQKLSSA